MNVHHNARSAPLRRAAMALAAVRDAALRQRRCGCPIAALRAAVVCDQSLGIKVTRGMADNGSCSTSFAFAAACKDLKLKPSRTKPCTPKTNGKAERFIPTARRDGASAQI